MAEMNNNNNNNKDKVIIPIDLWHKVLDALEDNKELRQQCYDSQVNLYGGDMDWIKGSLKDAGRTYPRVKDYLYRLIERISK